jgi:hypothetical protein
VQRQPFIGRRDHRRIEVASLPVLTWIAGAPAARMRSASFAVCWSPSITAIGAGGARSAAIVAQQRRLARAGARHEIQRAYAVRREMPPVVRRMAIVLAEHVLLDAHRAPLDQAMHRDAGRPEAVMQVTARRIGAHVRLSVVVRVMRIVPIPVRPVGAVAAAYHAHVVLLPQFG